MSAIPANPGSGWPLPTGSGQGGAGSHHDHANPSPNGQTTTPHVSPLGVNSMKAYYSGLRVRLPPRASLPRCPILGDS